MVSKKVILLLTCLISFSCGFSQYPFYNVLDYGAVNDGNTITTKAIQKVIDECAAKGGGTLIFPAGKYLSGTLILKDNIVLQLQAGAELLGSGQIKDYPEIPSDFVSYSVNFIDRSLIFGEGLHHVAITGHGKINGQGNLFPRGPEKTRPSIIRMVACQDISLQDITFENPAMWTQHYLGCQNITFDNVKVFAWNSDINNDGIDLDGCSNVMISNSYIKSGDDAICLKSDASAPCENIAITNCVLSSLANAIKCGTDSYGGFENITVSNCTITDTRLSGIALEIVDGGEMNNVVISNIVMKDVNNPIFVRLGDRGRHVKGTAQKTPGIIKNIKISNLAATGAGSFKQIGCPISGIPGNDIENISLTNISIAFKGGGSKADGSATIPENEKDYPEYWMFGNLPSYAFFIRHVKGLTMQNVELSYELPDSRPAVYLQDVENGMISDFRAVPGTVSGCQLLIDSSRKLLIRNCYTAEKGNLASIKNASTDLYFINNVLFNEHAKLISKDETIKESDVIIK